MFETTNLVLDNNDTLSSGIPAFVDVVARVKGGVAAIREKQRDQQSTGDAEAKQLTRDTVEELALLIGSQVSALATKTNDPVLAAKVNYDKSTLDKAAVSDLLIAAKSVQGAAADNSAVLISTYGITAAEMTQLCGCKFASRAGAAEVLDAKNVDAAITALERVKDTPRQAVVDRKVATMSLPDAIAYVRGIYRNELDKMMERFKKSEPDFYSAYFAARVIVDRTGTHAAPTKTTPAKPANP